MLSSLVQDKQGWEPGWSKSSKVSQVKSIKRNQRQNRNQGIVKFKATLDRQGRQKNTLEMKITGEAAVKR